MSKGWDAVRRWSLPAFAVLATAHILLVWFAGPQWTFQPDVIAPLTRRLLFFHPASAWTSFVAYFGVLAMSIALLNERNMRYDLPAQAMAEVGFVFNTFALWTGTFWGLPEWGRSGEAGLVTIYTEPKVLLVVLLWATFGGYLLLRRLVEESQRRARLSAIFGILGFAFVPLSFASSRLLQTSLHPDVAGPGANPDAAIGGIASFLLGFSFLVFLTLFLHVTLQRVRMLRLLEAKEVHDHD